MTDLEFDILDELYFVETFDNLLKKLHIEENILAKNLLNLLERGWIKCFSLDKQEVLFEVEKFEENYGQYCYLATKAGLMAHHSTH
jgi:hypothetical protein